MVLGVLTAAAWACDPLDDGLDRVLASLLDVRLAEAASALEATSPSLACGVPATPAQAARLFLLDGALASLQGRSADAADAFAAAARADASLWLDALGPALRAQRDAAAARPPGGRGTLVVRPPEVDVRVDGAEWVGQTLAAGLHLVQAQGADGAVGFGRVLLVQPDTEQVVTTGLVPPAPPPAPLAVAAPAPAAPEAARPPRAGPTPELLAGVGATAWFGRDLSGHDRAGELLEERALKVLAPIEVAGELGLGPAWLRVAGSAGPLLGGRLLYGVDGEWTGSAWAFGGELGAGVRAAGFSLGATGGVALPGRLAARLVAGRRLGPVRAELRGGANVATSGALEPAGGLWVLLDLPGGGR